MDFPEFYRSFFAPTLALGLVVIGWKVISGDNDKRETRKEIRALINEITRLTDELYAEAKGYFCDIDNVTQEDDALAREWDLKERLKRLESALQVLVKMSKAFYRAPTAFDDLSEKITGHAKFESKGYTGVLRPNDAALYALSLSRASLTEVLENAYIDSQVASSA